MVDGCGRLVDGYFEKPPFKNAHNSHFALKKDARNPVFTGRWTDTNSRSSRIYRQVDGWTDKMHYVSPPGAGALLRPAYSPNSTLQDGNRTDTLKIRPSKM